MDYDRQTPPPLSTLPPLTACRFVTPFILSAIVCRGFSSYCFLSFFLRVHCLAAMIAGSGQYADLCPFNDSFAPDVFVGSGLRSSSFFPQFVRDFCCHCEHLVRASPVGTFESCLPMTLMVHFSFSARQYYLRPSKALYCLLFCRGS